MNHVYMRLVARWRRALLPCIWHISRQRPARLSALCRSPAGPKLQLPQCVFTCSKAYRATAVTQQASAALPRGRRCAAYVVASAAVATQTLKIGTRGSPLALAQAYLTRDLLKVC